MANDLALPPLARDRFAPVHGVESLPVGTFVRDGG